MPRRRKRSVQRTLVNVALALPLFAAAAYGVTLISVPSFDFSSGRKHLQQIPISKTEACPHVEAIHRELTALEGTYELASFVESSIAEGRSQLPRIDDHGELQAYTSRLFERGKLHAGYASDLVGHQCRVGLGASGSTTLREVDDGVR